PASDGYLRHSCECMGWCRAEPQPITDKHHKNCPKYDEKIRVVRITHEGSSYYAADMIEGLQSLIDGDDYEYEIEFMQMLKRDYEALPEFQGF
ncbi:MAG TPA: hypothetical protein DCS09_03755, partial [Porphyromonadaceae bacterium]|nr:hypothetical protein [Porphyromonadaceae bacterium]